MPSAKNNEQSTVNVMVTLDKWHRDQLEEVAGQLESAGMNVAKKFALGGVIVGEVAASNIRKLKAIQGIKAVEEEPTFHAGR